MLSVAGGLPVVLLYLPSSIVVNQSIVFFGTAFFGANIFGTKCIFVEAYAKEIVIS